MGDKKLSSSGNADPEPNPATQKVTALKEEGNVAFKAGDTDAAPTASRPIPAKAAPTLAPNVKICVHTHTGGTHNSYST